MNFFRTDQFQNRHQFQLKHKLNFLIEKEHFIIGRVEHLIQLFGTRKLLFY